MSLDSHCHTASTVVSVPAERAFEYMSDPIKRGRWTLGSLDRRRVGPGLVVGTSAFDGSLLYSRVEAHLDLLLLDSYIGPSPDRLRPLVEVRIKPGEALGLDPGSCVVTMSTWRTTEVSDEEWEREFHVWRTEIHMLRRAVEDSL